MDFLYFENREYFAQRLSDLDSKPSSNSTSTPPSPPIESEETPDTSIIVRIRPLTEKEIDKDHVRGVLTDNAQVVNIHEPRRRVGPNPKPDLTSTSFTLHQVYGPSNSTEDIYHDRVEELVDWVQEGGMSMLLAYGQTGSGKTFTVTELERLVVGKLMDGEEAGKWDVHITVFEVAGSNMFDLLQNRAPLKVMEDSFGTMQMPGITEAHPTTSSEFLEIIDTAKLLRATESTSKNSQSSRSHAICRIRISPKSSPDAPTGEFLLVDLAGSEASSDTAHHSASRMAETREINKSLSILKDCIRARALYSQSLSSTSQNAKHVHIPFRGNRLTQVLKGAFDVNASKTCRTLVVACVSPSILDAGQGRNTLRYAEMLKVPMPKAAPRAYDERIPTTWGNEHVREWIRKNSSSTINPALLAPKEDGAAFCRLKEDEFVGRCLRSPGVQPEKAKLLYFKLWALHIDSRSLSTTAVPASVSDSDSTIVENGTGQKKTRVGKKRAVDPGSFWKLDEYYREGDVKVVMVLAPDSRGKKGDEGYIVGAVRETGEGSGKWELFVEDQRVIERKALGEQVGLKYDSETRYYYMR